jgi:hypothetical protein
MKTAANHHVFFYRDEHIRGVRRFFHSAVFPSWMEKEEEDFGAVQVGVVDS